MQNFVAQIAPQRSTQYSSLAAVLAPHELILCPMGIELSALQICMLGEQQYLSFHCQGEPTITDWYRLGSLAMTSGYFRLYSSIEHTPGPFLMPVKTGFVPRIPLELATSRRYQGKTNEMFTQWLCNIAKFSSDFASAPWPSLTVLDPLVGGGTTLFVGLTLGAELVAGVEQNTKVVRSTAQYLGQFAGTINRTVQLKEERLKKLGRRWTVTIGDSADYRASLRPQNDEVVKGQRALICSGETASSRQLLPGLKAHLIVTDLPYGIQHQGQVAHMIENALPVWTKMLRKGGVLAFSWDATRFTREKMVALVHQACDLRVLGTSPYDQFQHRVDRVIKQRDVIVARA